MNVLKHNSFCFNCIHYATILFLSHCFTRQCVIFGYLNTNIENKLLINHLFLIFKMYFYYSRILHFALLKAKIVKVRKIEVEIAKIDAHETQEFCKKLV